MPDGEPSSVNPGAAEQAADKFMEQTFPDPGTGDQSGGAGSPEEKRRELREGALEEQLSGVSAARPGFFKKGLGKVGDAAGVVGRTIGDTAGRIGGGIGEKAGGIGQVISSGELKQAVGIGFRHWAENLNPKNFVQKDWLWRIGFGVGAAESAAFIALPLPLKGFAKAGLNLAITQGTHLVLNLPRAREEARMQRLLKLYPASMDEEMAKIAEKYGKAHQRIKDFALGLSAGAMYLSLGSIVSEVGKEAFTATATGTPPPKMPAGLVGGEAPKIPTATAAPGPATETIASPTATPTIAAGPGGLPGGNLEVLATPTEVPPVTAFPTPAPTLAQPPAAAPFGPETPAQAGSPDIVQPPPAPLVSSPAAPLPTETGAIDLLLEDKAAEVGKVLPSMQDEVVKKALEQSNHTLADIDQAAIDRAHQAVQHALEEKANAVYDVSGGAEAGQNAFESWLAQDATHQQLTEVAQQAINEQTQVTEALTQNVSSALETAPDLFVDQAIAQGSNVGQMLQDAGYQVTWTGADAPMLGAHIAANNDMLTDMWQQMAANHNIPESPFPVGLTEINDLVAKAQTGDKEALRKLLAALRYIPAGQKLKILNKEGISAVLGALG